MLKPEQKRQLRIEIKELEDKAAERKQYLIDNIDAHNFDEISRDKRAIDVKIETKTRQINEIDSSRTGNSARSQIFIPLNNGGYSY